MGEYDAKAAPSTKPVVASSKAPLPKPDRPAVYLREPKIAAKLWHAIDAHLAKVDLPAPAKALWIDENLFVTRTLEYLRPFESFLTRDRLPDLLFPSKSYESFSHLVPPKDIWEPAIGVALAPLFEEAILGSLRRLGPRWVELAENQPEPEALVDDRKSLVAESRLIPSHPMDLAVRHGLTADGVVDLKAGVLPVAKRKKLRAQRQVKVHWQGGRDRALWNFVRPEPADATAEEVAAALFTNYFWRADGAIYAHRLTKVGDLYGVPDGMARKFEAAREHAPDKVKSRDQASAGSKSADDLARIEAAKQPASVPKLRSLIADSVTQLEWIATALEPWKLDQTVAVGLAWATSKRSAPDAKLFSLAGPITEQNELLAEIVSFLKPITKRSLSSEERAVLRDTLALYARAAASSHLPATARRVLASAARKQVDTTLSALRATTTDLAAVTQYGDPSGRAQELTGASRRLQTQLLQSGAADGREVETTILASQEAALQARLSGLEAQSGQLLALANEAKSVWVLWHRRFDQIRDIAVRLSLHVEFVRGVWSTDAQVVVRGDSDHAYRESIDARRRALAHAQREFDKLRADKEVVDLLQNGVDIIKDHASYVKWTKVLVIAAAMVGVSFIASVAASRIGSAIAGRLVGAELVQGAGLLAQGGRLVATGLEAIAAPATDVVINSVGQVAIQGGSLKEALLENTLQTLVSTVIMRRIGGSLELAKQVERKTAKLWSVRDRAGAAILDAGVTVSAHIIINIATAYVARQITQRVLPVHGAAGGESDAIEEVFMQGASIALGRLVHGRLDSNKELHDKLAKHPRGSSLVAHRNKLQQLADRAEHSPRSEQGLELLAELKALHGAEQALLEHIRDNPSGPDVGINPAVAGAHAKRLARTNDLDGVGLEALPLRQAHLHEVIPGEHWTGTREQIEHAIRLARGPFEVTSTRDPVTGRWRVTIDKQTLILEERSLSQTPTSKQAKSVARTGSVETRAEVVPGSTFRGLHETSADLQPGDVKATLESVLKQSKHVDTVEFIDVDGTRSDVKNRQAFTALVTLVREGRAEARKLTIRIDTAPLEGLTVARSWVNSTQQGFSSVKAKLNRVLGRHVIQLSNRLDPVHAERAIAHEVAEILEIDRLNFEGKYGGPDALRPDAYGTELSPHDRGRIAEIEVLAKSTDAHAESELQALIEHLGLREGTPGADQRLSLARRHLSSKAAERLRTARQEPTSDVGRAQLANLREKARQDQAAERERASARDQVGHEMPSLHDADGKALTGAALTKAAADAKKHREVRSQETFRALKKVQADHAGEGFPILPYPGVMIGGGASLAGRDRTHLLVDDRGRWQADGNLELAQTGNQLKHTADAKLGDPRIHVGPNERLPLEVVAAWEDNIAAQGPVLDGRANLRFGPKGETLIDFLVGGEKLTFRYQTTLTIATGFVPERIPNAPFNLRPADAARALKETLRLIIGRTQDVGIRTSAIKAHEHFEKTSIVTNDDAIHFLDEGVIDPALRNILEHDDSFKAALQYGTAAKEWKQIRSSDDPSHPHVFFGDQANLGREQAMRSNNWVIGGLGGTGVSAAELILKNNAVARVTIVGEDSPAGLLENDQFRMLAEDHADHPLAKSMGIVKHTSERLSIALGRVEGLKKADGNHPLVDESNISPAHRSRHVYDANAKNSKTGERVHAVGTAYVAALGRNADYPPVVAQMIEQWRLRGDKGGYTIEPLFHDRQYVGYRVRFKLADNKTVSTTDVTGAASRFLPIADAIEHADSEAITAAGLTVKKAFQGATAATDWDSPSESGNFAGGFAATSTQTARYGQFRNAETNKVKR